ncbi:ArdC family protein [Ruegeria sp. HKCCD8929]|uniref:ArdC family protein n=1 Tax=Ruegeria sp. HKCCD8929 TaxID=2683006 RepID=UPI0014886C72|nr:ArdC-like ssDNA-binding domain-containing protein [Ruegeria sp. HKCCD8929]
MGKPKFDVYTHVTNQILAELKKGTVPWRQPWSGGQGGLTLPRRVTGAQYRGINVLMLWIAAMNHGFSASSWMTYKQSLDLGGQVRRGEKSTTVIKYGEIRKDDGNGVDGEPSVIRYARAYRVFNCDQIDGLDAHWYDRPAGIRDFGTESDPELDAWFHRLGIGIQHSDEPRAYYDPTRDLIHMPPVHTFETAHGYFDTLSHECAHAISDGRRLNITFPGKTRRNQVPHHEIFAELGGAMLCARLGIQPSFEQNAAYLQSWIETLEDDHKAILRAAAHAQAAADWAFDKAGEPVAPSGQEAA